jgi:peptidoglycan hydrolase CwlO-like protein
MVLQQIQDQELHKRLNDDSENPLNGSLQRCLEQLKDVSRQIEKYQEKMNKPKDFKERVKGVWQRLMFNEEKITQLAEKINNQIAELKLCLIYENR